MSESDKIRAIIDRINSHLDQLPTKRDWILFLGLTLIGVSLLALLR